MYDEGLVSFMNVDVFSNSKEMMNAPIDRWAEAIHRRNTNVQ